MQKINDGVPRCFWCPRCGTLKMDGSVPEHESPRFLHIVLRNLTNYDDSCQRSEPGPLCGVLWAKVSHLFGLGATSADAMCRALEFNPNETRA